MLTKKEKEEFKINNEGKEIKSIDDLVLVHVTDYIPEGGIIHSPKDAGVKFQEEFDGVQYELPSQRKTVHFTMNGDITGVEHIGGSWQNKKYAIIIPLNLIDKEDFVGGLTVDFYSKDSFKIPEGAYILCSEEEKENIQKEVGEGINVIGVEGKYIDGYTSILLQNLGYKNETIPADWGWHNEKDNEAARKIIAQNWKEEQHTLSSEMSDELINQDIIRTSIIAKILKDKNKLDKNSIDNIFCKHHYMGNSASIFLKDEYFGTLLQSLNEIAGINIPQSVIDEIYDIKNGNITDQQMEDSMEINEYIKSKREHYGFEFFRKNNSQSQWIAENILRRRILGEIRLSQIQDLVEQNPNITFDELSEHFDDIAYDYTTEDRRNEFLNSMELDLSEVDKKVLCSKELKELYSEINEIKDIPYERLSEEQKEKANQFKKYYEGEYKKHFDGYRLTSRPMRDENGYLSTYMTIMRDDFNNLTPEEMQKIQSECIGIDEETAFLDFETKMQGETTLSQYLLEYENYITKLDELMNERNKDSVNQEDEISVDSLGKQTLEEQKDTEAKIDMQQKLQQKMKEYAISQEEKGEEK